MPSKPIRRAAAVAGGVAALIAGTATGPALAAGQPAHGSPSPIRHVLLISVDGLHQPDLAWYVRTHPHSALAGLETTGSSTPGPAPRSRPTRSPGMVGQVTGGDPGITGVYYDDTFNHGAFPPGTTNVHRPGPGRRRSTTTRATTSTRPPSTRARGWPGCPAASCR